MPKGLSVKGNLNAKGSKIIRLPKNLVVGEDLDLRDCILLEELPDGLIVEGNLSLNGTNYIKFPDNFIVKGTLTLQECSWLS